MKSVILIGTRHSIQRDFNQKEFEIYITNIVKEKKIGAIAEEIDQDSIAMKVSKEFSLNYLAIEPTPSERENLGIPSLSQIENSIFMDFDDNESSEAQEELRIRKNNSYRNRENEWLRRINKIKETSILIICGEAHFEPFRELLSKNKINIDDKSRIWK